LVADDAMLAACINKGSGPRRRAGRVGHSLPDVILCAQVFHLHAWAQKGERKTQFVDRGDKQ
jgi:hypothetical protein